MTSVIIHNGTYFNNPIKGTFPMIAPPKDSAKGGMFVTVDGSSMGYPNRIRVRIESTRDIELSSSEAYGNAEAEDPITLEERIANIRERFEVMDVMVNALIEGHANGLIISGPPGVGKSFTVEKRVNNYAALLELGEREAVAECLKGTATPVHLYMKLYAASARGSILVLDDSDSILFDEQCLNMLKAVLDTGKTRRLSYLAESRVLEEKGIPNSFEFQGAIVFITNLKFDECRSAKIAEHLAALVSRCHYLDMGIDCREDLFARIRQILDDGMLDQKGFTKFEQAEIVDFIEGNGDRLREISLRMVVKIADLMRMSPTGWQKLADQTCLRRV
jgi:hypothetical protein